MSEPSNQSAELKEDTLKNHPPTVIGWLVRLASLLFLTVLVGTILWKIAQPKREVEFTTHVVAEKIRRQHDQYLVPVEVTNVGSSPALAVEIVLKAGEQEHEISMPMIGEQETFTFVVGVSDLKSTFSHEVQSYQAP